MKVMMMKTSIERLINILTQHSPDECMYMQIQMATRSTRDVSKQGPSRRCASSPLMA